MQIAPGTTHPSVIWALCYSARDMRIVGNHTLGRSRVFVTWNSTGCLALVIDAWFAGKKLGDIFYRLHYKKKIKNKSGIEVWHFSLTQTFTRLLSQTCARLLPDKYFLTGSYQVEVTDGRGDALLSHHIHHRILVSQVSRGSYWTRYAATKKDILVISVWVIEGSFKEFWLFMRATFIRW